MESFKLGNNYIDRNQCKYCELFLKGVCLFFCAFMALILFGEYVLKKEGDSNTAFFIDPDFTDSNKDFKKEEKKSKVEDDDETTKLKGKRGRK